MRSRLSGSRCDESAQVGSQKRKSLVSGAVWYQTKHGNPKYDIEMRYCHFDSHTYSQIYDGRARARTADTHRSSHDTDTAQLHDETRAYMRQLYQKLIQPAEAAQTSAPEALSGPTQLQTQPTCESRAGGGHAVHDAAESLRGRQRGVRWCEREPCYEWGR